MVKKKKKASFRDEPKPDKTTDMTGVFPPDMGEPMQLQPQEAPQGGVPQGADQVQMLSQMMQSFQSMMNFGALPQQWGSSQPFQEVQGEIEPEAVPHDIILPKTLERGSVKQKGIDLHPLFSKLFLDDTGSLLSGIPSGCTITLTGPAYSGKTRSALEMIVKAVMSGIKTAYVVAEEGFYDEVDSGRNDLFSRFLDVAKNISGLTEKQFRKKYDDDYLIIPNQYHLGKSWADFIKDYRFAVETHGCKLTIIDSINMLDPSKLNTVDNLNALKTYNHEKGITCIVIGQVKDSGVPQGGEALFHSSEVSIHLYERTMTSKDLAAKWGSEYRASVNLVTARSKVCPTVNFPIKVIENEMGLLRADPVQPIDHNIPDGFWDN
ncbi:MAG: hypothetical protein IH840_02075 [Candidatus Heimdallarchaeota archaeon]|nr:hypothetical protein [Candidatus Heimdallarchaeota archaeon]